MLEVSRSQVITKGTELGILHEAEVMDEFQETKSGDKQVKDEKLSSLEREAIEKMMSNLPANWRTNNETR